MGWELDWLENRARLTPDSIALIEAEKNQMLTYKEINNRANGLAGWLADQGIGKGDRVALLSPNHISYFDLLFACGKLGAIFVPVNWRLSSEEIKYILQDCTPKIIGCHSNFSNIVMKVTNKHSKMIQTNSDRYEQIVKNKIEGMEKTAFLETDPLIIIYTGGTTGKPKGVVLSHQSIIWNAINTIISWGLNEKDVTLTYLPLFHTGGLNALSIPLLMSGGKVVIADQFDPVQAMDYLNSYKCTIVLFVPTMYHMISEKPEFSYASFPFTKTFLSGGAPCPLEIYAKFKNKGLQFKEGYGLTEAGPNNFFIGLEDADRKRGSVGKPMIINEVKIVKEDGTEARENETGELLIKGKHTFSHYWNNEEATKDAKKNDWLHTGDLARKDSEGYYYIVGRKKEIIITGGENVYPLEIEQWLSAHPDINEAAVIGLPDEKWGERVSAFISLKVDGALTVEEVQMYCRSKLGSYKIPRTIVILDELPKTHVGKVDKKELKRIGIQFQIEK
ncbi:acyl-CoA synthetase [Cytobacillus dafuensis]|uniref:Long-chain fatty acid--CoA ligase n=1 Tax=Cytobacillus dafuensis TaxID=1742359 RepID=A0A5B8Z2M3_CYTDA|nr:long-chain fatty acid--CoA ligase [Cytobacillus dafuensis]QED47178.1 long-chain fatty acid--CoA ligase [Cytobacillus dafuensis]